jgi:hypothetical protein
MAAETTGWSARSCCTRQKGSGSSPHPGRETFALETQSGHYLGKVMLGLENHSGKVMLGLENHLVHHPGKVMLGLENH